MELDKVVPASVSDERILMMGADGNDNQSLQSVDLQETDKFLLTSPWRVTVKPASHHQTRCTHMKALQTLAAYCTYFVTGMFVTILSSSLLDLEAQTGSSTQQIALLFTWQYLGRLPAVLLFGLIADRINKEVQLGLGMLAMAVVVTCCPFCVNYILLSVMVGLSGCSIGFLGGSATGYMLMLWESPSALLGMHLAMSIGCTLGPLVAKPFLSKNISQTTFLNSTNESIAFIDTTISFVILPETVTVSRINDSLRTLGLFPASRNITSVSGMEPVTVSTSQLSTVNLKDGGGVTMISTAISALVYPYIIMGCIDLGIAALYLVIFCTHRYQKKAVRNIQEKPTGAKPDTSDTGNVSAQPQVRKGRRWVLLLSLYCMFLLLDGAAESTYSSLLVIYAYKALHMTKESSTIINAAFWGPLCVGRMAGMVISNCGYLRVNIAVSVAASVISMATLSLFSASHVSVIWMSSILLGLALSTTVGNTLVVAKRRLHTSGFILSVLMFSLYSGMMLGPALASWLFKMCGIGVFPHLILVYVFLMALVFVPILCMGDKLRGVT